MCGPSREGSFESLYGIKSHESYGYKSSTSSSATVAVMPTSRRGFSASSSSKFNGNLLSKNGNTPKKDVEINYRENSRGLIFEWICSALTKCKNVILTCFYFTQQDVEDLGKHLNSSKLNQNTRKYQVEISSPQVCSFKKI